MSKLARGLPLFVAAAASLLHGGLAATVSVQPGGLQSALDNVGPDHVKRANGTRE